MAAAAGSNGGGGGPETDQVVTMKKGAFMRWVAAQVETEASCMELPLTLILVLSFACLSIFHVQNHRIYGVEEAIEFDIEDNANFAWSHAFGHKGIHDVNSIADFWSWTRLGLEGVMF